MKREFRKGTFLRVTQNINCIPEGIYRFDGKIEGFFTFRIGRKVHFGISEDCEEMLSYVIEGKATSPKEFVEKYYGLLPAQRNKMWEPGSPFTICALAPELILQKVSSSTE